MKRNLSKLLCTAMALIMFFTPNIVYISANSLEFDISLQNEVEQFGDISNKIFKMDINNDIELKNSMIPYIPAGANCTEVTTIGDTIYIDYQLNNARYIIAYYADGTIEKYVRINGSDDIYMVNSKNTFLEHTNVKENLKEVSITDEEAKERMENLKNKYNKIEPLYLLENKATTSKKVVWPISYKKDPSTAPYKAKIVSRGHLRIDSLSSKGYNVWQPFKVYETMSYHTEILRKSLAFAIGKTVANIAMALAVPASTVKAWLNIAGILYSTSGILKEACEVVKKSEYRYWGGKELGIYDPTSNKSEVEVFSDWGEGIITMTWQYNSATGYNTPKWGHSALSSGLQKDNNYVIEEGRRIYDSNIKEYGLWKWGKGNGFGY